MTLISRLGVLLFLLCLTGCSTLQGFSLRPYRMNVQQGNFLEAKDIDQIQVGMTRGQVRFLIGTPMVADPFNTERWDYVFFFKIGRTRDEIVTNMTIWFENDRVVRIDRPEDVDAIRSRDEADFDA
jgi:outer membrane protein assembly factor BamE